MTTLENINNSTANWLSSIAKASRVFVLVILSLFSLASHSQQYKINFDPTFDSSDFFNVDSVDHRNSYIVSRHWWDGVSSINIAGLNNDELYSSAQSLRDTSMSLNHKLLNYHWLTSWHNLGNNSLREDNTKKQLRKAAHILLGYSWGNYRKRSLSTSHKPLGQLNIKYRLRVNQDKAKLSFSVDF